MRARWIALFLALLFLIPLEANAEKRRYRIRKPVPAPLPIGGCTHPDVRRFRVDTWHLFAYDLNKYVPLRHRNKSNYCLEMWSNGLTTALYEGRYSNAIEFAYRIYGAEYIDAWARNPGVASMEQQRITYIVALSVLRTDGMVARVGHGASRPTTMSEIDRFSSVVPSVDAEANLSWATATLDSLATVGWVDRVHLAEAREHLDGSPLAREAGLLQPKPQPIVLSSKQTAPGTPKNAPEHQRYKDYVRALRNAQYAGLVDAAYEEFGYAVNGWAFNPKAANWSQRGIAYVVALAVLRSEGQVSRHGITDAAANVEWATRTLESLAMTGRVRELHLAEAWGRDPSTHDAALRVLEKHHRWPGLKEPAQILLLERLHRLARQT